MKCRLAKYVFLLLFLLYAGIAVHLAGTEAAPLSEQSATDFVLRSPIIILPFPPLITCPPDITVLCSQTTDPGVTGTASAVSTCFFPGNLLITYTDSVPQPDLNLPQTTVFTRTWTATDGCGSSSCNQIIRQERFTVPIVTISEISNADGTVKQYTVSANEVIQHVSWDAFPHLLNGQPGVTFGNNTITINFLIYEGGALLNTTFNLRAQVLSPCNAGMGGINSGIGQPPLYSLSLGGNPATVSGTLFPTAAILASTCGDVDLGSPTFRFQAEQQGFMRIVCSSPSTRVVAIRDLTTLTLLRGFDPV